MTLYQFLPYPENKPPANDFYNCICRGPNGDPEKGLIHYHSDTGWKNGFYNDVVTHFLAPIPSYPGDEKAAALYAVDYESERDYKAAKKAFLAGCAHKAQTTYTRQQMEDCWEAGQLYHHYSDGPGPYAPDRDTFINSLRQETENKK